MQGVSNVIWRPLGFFTALHHLIFWSSQREEKWQAGHKPNSSSPFPPGPQLLKWAFYLVVFSCNHCLKSRWLGYSRCLGNFLSTKKIDSTFSQRDKFLWSDDVVNERECVSWCSTLSSYQWWKKNIFCLWRQILCLCVWGGGIFACFFVFLWFCMRKPPVLRKHVSTHKETNAYTRTHGKAWGHR